MLSMLGAMPPPVHAQDMFLAKSSSLEVAPVIRAANAGFESSCESDADFGFPRFHSLDDLKASKPWANHFMNVYGELPSLGYPICMFDFWYFDNTTDLASLGLKPIANKAGGKPHGRQLPTWITNILGQYYPGLAYRYDKGEYVNGDLYVSLINGGYTVYRDWYLYHQLPSNKWVEVLHDAGPLFKREIEGMWFTRARGSGIWFNVGETIAFDSHIDAFKHLFNGIGDCKQPPPLTNTTDPMAQGAVMENAACKCARSKGYDSIQFRPNPYPVLNTFGSAGWVELVSTRLAGKFACGTAAGGVSSIFRSGWKASRACSCDPSQRVTNCRIDALV